MEQCTGPYRMTAQRGGPRPASLALLLLVALAAAGAQVVKMERINPPSIEVRSPFVPRIAAISAGGRFVAFQSMKGGIYVTDRQTVTTETVSVSGSGTPVEDGCEHPTISADGRFVAFQSWDPNLVPGDTNEANDVFVYDRQDRKTELISMAWPGWPANGGLPEGGWQPAISADGRYVVFESSSSDLLAETTSIGEVGIFLRDRQSGETQIISETTSYTPTISTDGRFVAFASEAAAPRSGDTDVHVWDQQTGKTEQLGAGFSPVISGDGRFVAFMSGTQTSPQLTAVFVRDRQMGKTQLISIADDGTPANWHSRYPTISADGRFVAFESGATNLVPGPVSDQQIYLWDRQTEKIDRVSVAADGSAANSFCYNPTIDAEGRFVAFGSPATNLVPGPAEQFALFLVEFNQEPG